MKSFTLEWDEGDLRGAIAQGFSYLESKDLIVGYVYAHPAMIKKIVLAVPDEVSFDFIPEGIGFIRTAYIKYKYMKHNEICFEDQEKSIEVRVTLK